MTAHDHGPIPATMRAVVLTGHGGLDRLEYRTDWPVPAPGPRQVLIKVGACGMNNTDINTRTGWYSRTVTEGTSADGGAAGFGTITADAATWGGAGIRFPRIQGADVSGRVVTVGDEVDHGLIGRRVLVDTWLRDPADPDDPTKTGYFGSECDGGFAEYTTAPVANVHPHSSGLSDVDLASFATSYVTAENMLRRADVGPADVVLVPGASGGVGSALIQLAHRRGARTVALCGPAKADQVRELGPIAVLPREPRNLAEALKEATGRPDVDVVADVVGGPMWPQMIDCLRRGGRYTCAGAIAGPVVAFDLRAFYLNDLTFTGATVVPKGVFSDLVGYIERGEIRPLVAATWPLHELWAAQEAFLSKGHFGNLVIRIAEDP